METIIPSYPYVEPVNGGFEGDLPSDGGGGGVDIQALVNRDNLWNMTDSGSMINTDGYVLADYNSDNHYDQAWYADGDGNWWTTEGGEWRRDDGPMEEWERLEDEESD